jgi:hypothetical protein
MNWKGGIIYGTLFVGNCILLNKHKKINKYVIPEFIYIHNFFISTIALSLLLQFPRLLVFTISSHSIILFLNIFQYYII